MARLARPWAFVGAGGQRGGPREGAVEDGLGRHHLVDEPDGERLVGPHLAAGEDQVLGPAGPTRRASRCVPPPPGMMPSRISGWPSVAFSLAMRKSHASASSQPPPSAKPVIGRDGGAGDGGDGVEGAEEQLTDQLGLGAGDHLVGRLAAELGDVGAGREDPVAAGDHDGAGRVVAQRLGGRA